jgi:hypothetical protein
MRKNEERKEHHRLLRIAVAIPALLISTVCYAQPKVVVFSGINFPTFPLRQNTFYLEAYWKNAINFGASLEFELSKSVRLSPGLEYNLYPFDSYAGPLDGGFFGTVYVKSASGESAKIYRLLLELMYFPEVPAKSVSRPFLRFGFGYIVEDIGPIQVLMADLRGFEWLRNLDFERKRYFAQTAGIGMRWNAGKNIFLNVEGKIFTNYTDRFQNSWNIGLMLPL